MLDGFTPWPEPFAQRYRDKGLWRGQTLGSLLRGVLWETTAVPDIRLQAENLARQISGKSN